VDGVLGWIAIGLAIVAIAMAAWAWYTARVPRLRRGVPIPPALEALRKEVEALREDTDQALRHLAVVRYDAFRDMGGHLSWSMALVDNEGNGIVLTAIHGRSDTRTYAKNISGWSCDQQLSPEEKEAIGYARGRR
jgi:Protein of unknown function (DUF4446)